MPLRSDNFLIFGESFSIAVIKEGKAHDGHVVSA